MPTYEYQCKHCGHQLEAFQKMSEAPLMECPKCHQAALTKLISPAGFQLKGSGWYATDYSKKSKPKESEAPKESSESKPSESKTETPKSDTSSKSGDASS